MRIGIDAVMVAGHRWGVHRALEGLLSGLAVGRTGHEFIVYTGEAGTLEPPRAPGFEVREIPQAEKGSARRLWWQYTQLPDMLAEDGVDVFHAARYVGPWKCPVPMVATVYDVIALTHPHLVTRANRWHYRWAIPRTTRSSARVITPSAYTRNMLVEKLPEAEGKVVVAPLGVTGGEASAEEREAVRAGHGLPARFLLFVGHVERKKNVPALVRAFARGRRDRRWPHHLAIAGTLGGDATAVRAAVRDCDVRECVHLLGPVDEAALGPLYAAAEVLVHWSLVEGFGLTVLEAMAWGTPVVCSDAGALAEVAGDVACVVALDDGDGLVEAIAELTSNEVLRGEMGRRGREWAAQFTWERHAESAVAAYEAAHRG